MVSMFAMLVPLHPKGGLFMFGGLIGVLGWYLWYSLKKGNIILFGGTCSGCGRYRRKQEPTGYWVTVIFYSIGLVLLFWALYLCIHALYLKPNNQSNLSTPAPTHLTN